MKHVIFGIKTAVMSTFYERGSKMNENLMHDVSLGESALLIFRALEAAVSKGVLLQSLTNF